MPSKAKKLLITTVSHEVFVVRVNQQTTIHGYCSKCDAEVETLSLDAAVNESGVSGRELIRQLASEEIHTLETADGHLLVCRNSLQQ